MCSQIPCLSPQEPVHTLPLIPASCRSAPGRRLYPHFPIEPHPHEKAWSHSLSTNCSMLLAWTHLAQSTAAKALCQQLPRASRLLSSPPLPSKLCADSKSQEPLIISEMESLKIFLIPSHKSKRRTTCSTPCWGQWLLPQSQGEV